jgi:hypothetical protein
VGRSLHGPLTMYLSNDTPLIDVANAYAKRGLHVFPCHTLENGNACSCGNAECKDVAKHPLAERGCYDATTEAETLNRFFTGDYASANIALATGEASGVFVLDVDDMKALASLEAKHAPLPKTWIVETGSGGRHYYFRFNERCQTLKNVVKFAGSLDVRTTGGYVLLPPSLHASGQRYRWLVSPDDCDLADAPDWLLSLIPRKGEQCEQRPEPTSSNSQLPTHTLTISRATTLAERATLYLASCPPAVSGQNGHGTTFAVVCRVVELFGSLTDDELLAALNTWNARCSPPWKEHELRHKLADARAKAKVTQQTPDDLSSCDDDDADVPTLDASAYVGIVGDIVKTIEPETEADSAGVLLTLLTCVGNAIGRTPTFGVGGDVHHANMFLCLVGDTSAGKGLAWGVVDYLMRQVDSDWRNNCVAYGLSSGEGLVERLADPEQENKTADDLIIADYNADDWRDKTTTTSVIVFPPVKRLLCLETEFARPITAMRREGNTLSPLLRAAWDAKTLEVMTRGKSKLRASNAHVSVVAHITPEELQKILSGSVETANGFANRFLWASVRSSKDLPNGGNVSVLDRFITPLRKALERAKTITTMTRSADAERLWSDVYASLKYGNANVTKRGRGNVLRLAMTLALCDGSPTIETQHLEAALSVWRYCEDSALMFFSENALASRLRQTIRQRPGIMRSELRLTISHATSMTQPFDEAIAWLLRRGDIVCVPVYEERQAERYYPSAFRRVGNRETLRLSQSEQSEQTSEPTSPISQLPTISETPAMTLAALLEWKNAHAVRFHRQDDGVVWVTDDYASFLSPAVEQAIHAYQDALSVFCDAEGYSSVTLHDAGDDLLKGERVASSEDDPALLRTLRMKGIDVERFHALRNALADHGMKNVFAEIIAMDYAHSAPLSADALRHYVTQNVERWRQRVKSEWAWASDMKQTGA